MSETVTITAPALSSRSTARQADRSSTARFAAGIAVALAVIDIALGVTVLLGWAANLPLLTSALPGLVPMKVNVAISLVLLGAGLLLTTDRATSSLGTPGEAVRNALALIVLALSLATLVEYLAGVDLGIDQALFREPLDVNTPYPGRPAVPVVGALICGAVAVLTIGRRWRGFHPTEALALVVGFIGGIVLLGYAYGAQGLISLGSPNRMSLLAAPGLLVLAGALLAANPDHAAVRQLTDPGGAGQLVRRFVPAALLVVPVGALIRLEGERSGLYDTATGLTFMTLFEGAILLAVGAWTARRIQVEEAANVDAFLYTRGLLESSLDPLVTISPAGKITDVNRATEQATGHSREELIGTDFADYFTEPDQARAGYQAVLRDGLVRDYPLRICHAGGSTADVVYNAAVYRDQNGRLQGVFAAARDVTRQRALEAERDRREELLQEQAGLIDSAHDAILVRAFEGTIRFWNAGAERTYGWTSSEAVGQVTHQLLRTRFPQSLEALEQALHERGEWEGQLRHTTKDGRTVIVQSRQVVERDTVGRPIAVLEINRDVTEEVAAQEHLEESASELRRSNSDLEQFAYVASHDLQEPLRMVTGFVGLLERRYGDQLAPEAKEYMDFAVEGAHRMQALINDLLTYSRVGRRPFEFEKMNLAEAVDRACGNLAMALGESHASIQCDELPELWVDRPQMAQLFQNLISNAIKFHGTSNPEISIGSRLEGREWRIFVKDNGIGIAPEHTDQIFVIFRRLHSRDEYPGSGIGLAICKKIVERHGGEIGVESEPGQGATFWFTLPDVERSHLGAE
jgi:PAS domain S-box-containing protein